MTKGDSKIDGEVNADDKVNVNRRAALKTAAALGAAATGAAVVASVVTAHGPNQTGQQGPTIIGGAARKLRMVTTWPRDFPGLGTGAARLGQRINDASGGSLDVTVYGAGELVPALSAFDAVSQGKADMYHGAEYYWQGRSLAFNFFAAVPMGLTAAEMEAWIRFGGGQELWDELSARHNIKPMIAGNTGVQMGGWFKRRVNGLADFRGLRIRMPGLGGEVMKRLGATPVTKAGGELFQALDQGNIDASEWVGPWNDMAFAFHSIVKNYYYPGIHEPGSALSLGINMELWNDLSQREQAVISNAAAAESVVMHAEFEHQNALSLERLLNSTDVSVLRFSDTIVKRMAEISTEVLEEVAAADSFTARVYESFLAARQRGDRWGDVSERAYAHARSLLPARVRGEP